MLEPKCSVCKAVIKSGEFMAVIGTQRDAFVRILTSGRGWPYINPLYIYCKSCFNKKYKEK